MTALLPLKIGLLIACVTSRFGKLKRGRAVLIQAFAVPNGHALTSTMQAPISCVRTISHTLKYGSNYQPVASSADVGLSVLSAVVGDAPDAPGMGNWNPEVLFFCWAC